MDLEKIAAAMMQNATIQNVHFNDIHDNQHVYVGTETGTLTETGTHKDPEGKPAAEKSASTSDSTPPEELYHFIHPALGDEERKQIHDEVKRLVTRFGIQEICLHLSRLEKEKKLMQTQNVKVAYEEAVRMGMPTTDGFAYKTFEKYYRK